MKATMHCGHVGSAKHNARDFDTTRSTINQTRTADNVTLFKGKQDGLTMEQSELQFYETNFRKRLDAVNARYVAQRHPERCRSMEEYYHAHPPEEVILQIGDASSHADAETLLACVRDWNKHMRSVIETQNPKVHCSTISISLHVDETTPHVHLRRVWSCQAKDGTWDVNQSRALKQLGVVLPDPDKPEGRYNNRKVTWDAWARRELIRICHEHGVEIEDTPEPRRRHETVHAYRAQAEREAVQVREWTDRTLADLKTAQDAIDAAQKAFPEAFRVKTDGLQRAADSLKKQAEAFDDHDDADGR